MTWPVEEKLTSLQLVLRTTRVAAKETGDELDRVAGARIRRSVQRVEEVATAASDDAGGDKITAAIERQKQILEQMKTEQAALSGNAPAADPERMRMQVYVKDLELTLKEIDERLKYDENEGRYDGRSTDVITEEIYRLRDDRVKTEGLLETAREELKNYHVEQQASTMSDARRAIELEKLRVIQAFAERELEQLEAQRLKGAPPTDPDAGKGTRLSDADDKKKSTGSKAEEEVAEEVATEVTRRVRTLSAKAVSRSFLVDIVRETQEAVDERDEVWQQASDAVPEIVKKGTQSRKNRASEMLQQVMDALNGDGGGVFASEGFAHDGKTEEFLSFFGRPAGSMPGGKLPGDGKSGGFITIDYIFQLIKDRAAMQEYMETKARGAETARLSFAMQAMDTFFHEMFSRIPMFFKRFVSLKELAEEYLKRGDNLEDELRRSSGKSGGYSSSRSSSSYSNNSSTGRGL